MGLVTDTQPMITIKLQSPLVSQVPWGAAPCNTEHTGGFIHSHLVHHNIRSVSSCGRAPPHVLLGGAIHGTLFTPFGVERGAACVVN